MSRTRKQSSPAHFAGGGNKDREMRGLRLLSFELLAALTISERSIKVEYEKKQVILEGTLELQMLAPLVPFECTNQARCRTPHTGYMVGNATTETGASNVANVERLLWILNGKDVRVTVEWNDTSPSQSA